MQNLRRVIGKDIHLGLCDDFSGVHTLVNIVNRAARHAVTRSERFFPRAKSGVQAGRGLWEFRLTDGEGEGIEVGAEIRVDIFEPGQRVDVSGTTRGKGFAGAIKRHHFAAQDATHGNSLSHRAPGSIGQNQSPGRVFKGKRMAGHMGDVTRAAQNLEVMRVDPERNLVLVKGAVPGAPGGNVMIRPSVKKR